jgi:hypothetical protein
MSIFNNKSLRSYLKQYIQGLPKRGRGEVSRIARHLRVSTTLVSQVLSGQKTFTMEQTKELGSFLGLGKLESDYLLLLVLAERAGNSELRKHWEEKLEEARAKSLHVANRVSTDRQLTDTERAVFYSSPLYSAVRLFTSTAKEGKSLDEICARFELARAKANGILSFLVQTGLCAEKNGRFAMGAQKTHLEQGSPFLLRHHGNWRMRALTRGEDLSAEELMYTAPVSLSKKDFAKLREEMLGFIDQFLKKVHASPAEEVACFNMDFFWVRK